jgi:hypothetical protein
MLNLSGSWAKEKVCRRREISLKRITGGTQRAVAEGLAHPGSRTPYLFVHVECSLVIVVGAFLVFSHAKYAETLSPTLSQLLDQHLPWQFHHSLPRRATSAPES